MLAVVVEQYPAVAAAACGATRRPYTFIVNRRFVCDESKLARYGDLRLTRRSGEPPNSR